MHGRTVQVIIGIEEPLLALGVATACTAEGVGVLATCGHRAALLRACAAPDPAVVVAQPALAARDLGALAERRRVLLVTDGAALDCAAALRAGAAGFVHPHAHPRELTDAIVQAAEGRVVLGRLQTAVTRQLLTPEEPRLTAREREVLSLVARGHSNRRIAQELSIGETTVKTNLRSINAKLGTTSRTGAAMRALRLGLLDRSWGPDGADGARREVPDRSSGGGA